MASKHIEDSLVHLLECGICLDEANPLKVLPCQHTFCLDCIKGLPTKKKRLKCPLCLKEHMIPSGGVKQLPDSLVTKQISDIIKERKTKLAAATDTERDCKDKEPLAGNEAVLPQLDEASLQLFQKFAGNFGFVPSSLRSHDLAHAEQQEVHASVKEGSLPAGGSEAAKRKVYRDVDTDAEVEKLQSGLEQALESGKRWYRRADQMVVHYTGLVKSMPDRSQIMVDAIEAYQQEVILKCQEKLSGVKNGAEDRTRELKICLTDVLPQTNQMKSLIQNVSPILNELSNKNASQKTVADANRLLEELKVLNCAVRRKPHDIDNFATIEAGESVRLLNLYEAFTDIGIMAQGRVHHGSIGRFYREIVQEIPNPSNPSMPLVRRQALVVFPEQPNWIGPTHTVEKSLTKAHIPFIADKVRVKASVSKPHFSWNGVRPKKSHGILNGLNHGELDGDLVVTVDFPEDHQWKGLYTEIELVPGCGLEVGDEVWINRSIPEPSRGWAEVNGSSVGKIKKIEGLKGQEEVTVDFRESKDWVGLATDLEHVREPTPGERVQVKLTVHTPAEGWRGISHDDEGILTTIYERCTNGWITYYTADVKFPEHPPWSCLLSEIEPTRYHPPKYDSIPSDEPDAIQEWQRVFQHIVGAWRNA